MASASLSSDAPIEVAVNGVPSLFDVFLEISGPAHGASIPGYLQLLPGVTLAPGTSAGVLISTCDVPARFKREAGDGIRAVEIEGRIRFSADKSRIEWMGNGAHLLVVTDDHGRNVRLRAEPDRDGQPAYRYEIDGRANRSDGDSERWLADTLPVVFRELGYDADARVRTAYEQGGADAVFRTLATIRSDHSAGQHYAAFFGRKDLTDDEIIGALSHLGADIDGDEELAKALFGVANLYRERPAIRTSYLACIDQVDSDVVRNRINRDLFGTETVSDSAPPTMLASAGGC